MFGVLVVYVVLFGGRCVATKLVVEAFVDVHNVLGAFGRFVAVICFSFDLWWALNGLARCVFWWFCLALFAFFVGGVFLVYCMVRLVCV